MRFNLLLIRLSFIFKLEDNNNSTDQYIFGFVITVALLIIDIPLLLKYISSPFRNSRRTRYKGHAGLTWR